MAQPNVEIVSTTTVEYEEFPRQPDVEIISTTTVEHDPPDVATDIEGDAEIIFTTEAELSLEITPVEVPFTVEQQDIDIVSVTMPVPEDFDQFGRPL